MTSKVCLHFWLSQNPFTYTPDRHGCCAGSKYTRDLRFIASDSNKLAWSYPTALAVKYVVSRRANLSTVDTAHVLPDAAEIADGHLHVYSSQNCSIPSCHACRGPSCLHMPTAGRLVLHTASTAVTPRVLMLYRAQRRTVET